MWCGLTRFLRGAPRRILFVQPQTFYSQALGVSCNDLRRYLHSWWFSICFYSASVNCIVYRLTWTQIIPLSTENVLRRIESKTDARAGAEPDSNSYFACSCINEHKFLDQGREWRLWARSSLLQRSPRVASSFGVHCSQRVRGIRGTSGCGDVVLCKNN